MTGSAAGGDATRAVGPSSGPASPVTESPALKLSDVRAAYGGIEVLHGVDLELPSTGIFALLGPNGAGKSTILRVITGHLTGQLKLTSGAIWSRGADITDKRSNWLGRRGLCLIPEGRGVFPNLTVAENLWMWTHSRRASRSTIEEIAFSRFPVLADRRSQLAGTLSGGQQQMLALSRALSTSPDILLIDELSMGLAPVLVEELYEGIRAIANDGVFVLFVEQSVTVALTVADQVGIVARGRIERFGDPEDVAAEALELYLS